MANEMSPSDPDGYYLLRGYVPFNRKLEDVSPLSLCVVVASHVAIWTPRSPAKASRKLRDHDATYGNHL